MNYGAFQGTGSVPVQYVFQQPTESLGNVFGDLKHDDRRALWGGCLDAPTIIPGGGTKTFFGLALTIGNSRYYL